MYCYLRARFGQPNGLCNVLRNPDTSDNYIHWDYLLKVSDENLYIMGLSREIQFVPSEAMTDTNWRALLANIRGDFGRVGREKSRVLDGLEKWLVFPNRYVQIANACADLHGSVVTNMDGASSFKGRSFQTKRESSAQAKEREKVAERAMEVYDKALQLSLLIPVLAEAFINMLALMLCKKEIKRNKRHFEHFMRQNVDTKVFDLPYKCDGFRKSIPTDAESIVHFKRIMDRRNHAIHGNVDPEKDNIEVVYFDGKIPLFKDGGDNVGRYQDAMERMYRPREVIRDYEGVFLFFEEVIACLEPRLVPDVRTIMEDPLPGYDVGRRVTGNLFPQNTIVGQLPGMKYDDEL